MFSQRFSLRGGLLAALFTALLFTLVITSSAAPIVAQVPEPEPRNGVSNAGFGDPGTQFITGTAKYTFPYFSTFLPQPFVVLYDITGQIVDRDRDFYPSPESQAFGTITTDPFVSPFKYELQLPAHPHGEFRDVDNNGQDNGGVMIFSVMVASNTWGDPFLEERDNFIVGVVGSIRISSDIDSYLETEDGMLIIYAPDGNQLFPSSFGTDGKLFTDDDPVTSVAQGYTIVNLNDPTHFTFDRTAEPDVPLVEAEDAELDDFSDKSYTESFDSMIDLLRHKYAFTEYKHLDWDAISAEFRPRVEQAEENQDLATFRKALADLALSIPDGHVSGPTDFEDYRTQVSGGLGLALSQLDDGRVLVNYLMPGGPADNAGIQLKAEITAVNDVPIEQALEETRLWSTSSSPVNRRLDQLTFVVRFPEDTQVSLTYTNPGESEQTAEMSAVFDRNGLINSGYRSGSKEVLPGELPVEYTIRDDGFAYVKIYGFTDNLPLTVSLWERFIEALNQQGVLGVIIDIRENGGGSGFLGDQLPAYFFDDEYVIGNTAHYSKTRGEFAVNPAEEDKFILPSNNLYYGGPVAVIISPNCASACESFAWAMSINQRAGIVGNYPTAGLGGSVVPIAMPDDTNFNYTNARSLDANGDINIEGKGVPPTVRVPVTEETLFSDEDVLLDAALGYLHQQLNFVDLGQTVSGEIVDGTPLRYRVQLTEGQL
ncbi:MAG TPA: S41 family peptidase, partial [Phototrophicaceae bacterium]|nr:S41 family peptidase [Phototrophicaceae bacterium]